jgi:hypothetical protein
MSVTDRPLRDINFDPPSVASFSDVKGSVRRPLGSLDGSHAPPLWIELSFPHTEEGITGRELPHAKNRSQDAWRHVGLRGLLWFVITVLKRGQGLTRVWISSARTARTRKSFTDRAAAKMLHVEGNSPEYRDIDRWNELCVDGDVHESSRTCRCIKCSSGLAQQSQINTPTRTSSLLATVDSLKFYRFKVDIVVHHVGDHSADREVLPLWQL